MNYHGGEVNCVPCPHKEVIGDYQCKRKTLRQSKVHTRGNAIYLQKSCMKLLFQLCFCSQSWASFGPHSTQEISKSKLPPSWTFSCFSISISVVLLAVSHAHAELHHLLLVAWYFTHTLPPPKFRKIPWATWFTSIQTLPCAWFLCSTRYWCKSLVSQGISIAFFTEGKVALTPANFWGV